MYTEYNAPTYDDYCALIYGSDSDEEPAFVCPTCGAKWYREAGYSAFETDAGDWCGVNPSAGGYCPCCMFDRIGDAALVEFAASGNVAAEIVQALLETDQPIEISADNRGKVIRAMYASDPAGCMDVIKEILHDQLPMEELIDWLNERKEVRKGA